MNLFSSNQSKSSGQVRQTSQPDSSALRERRRPDGPGSQLTAGQRGELSGATTPVLPPVDIFEDHAGVTIFADLPGVAKEHLGVRVEGDSLVIEGTASAPETGDMELLYGEVLNPFYRRSFTLSRDLDPGKIEANLNNGVLKLNIAKAEAAKPRRIEVKVG